MRRPADRDPAAGVPPPQRARRISSPAVILVVLAAIALRVWHLGHGLPSLLEEAYPLRRALEMWGWDTGRADWNPHFFFYPSLSFYLHFLVQKAHVACGLISGVFRNVADYHIAYETDPTSMVLAARAVGVACDVATVLAVVRLGERLHAGAGVPAALLVALAPVMILTSRAIYCDPLMAALATWGLERLLAYREGGSLAAGIILTGLAASAKYPGALLVVPLAAVVLERHGWRGVLLWIGAAAASLAVFLLTSPFVALDFTTFRAHFGFEAEHQAEGHFGRLGQASFLVHLGTLGGNLGWAGVLLLVVSLLLALAPAARRREARTLWLFLLPLWLTVSASRTAMERYLVPVIPVAAPLAVAAALEVADRLGRPRRALVAGLLVLAMVVPVGVGGVRAAASGAGSTQTAARRWCEAHLGRDHLLVQEPYGADLLDDERHSRVSESRAFQAASERARRRFRERPWFRVVELPIMVAGSPVSIVRVAGRPDVEVPIFAHGVDFSRVFYDPRVLEGVDFALTSSAVRGRYEADPERFAPQLRFYRFLDHDAKVAARFTPGRGVDGPEIVVYQLDATTWSALRERQGPLPELWWAEAIPATYRRRVEELTLPPAARSGGALRTREGMPSPWVTGLREVFDRRIALFANRMAVELAELGRYREARGFAAAILTMLPADRAAFLVFGVCTFELAPPAQAKATMEALLRRLERQDPAAAALRPEYARMLEDFLRPAAGSAPARR